MIWQDQSYELVDASGKVIYAVPNSARLGESRTVHSLPEDSEAQFIAE